MPDLSAIIEMVIGMKEERNNVANATVILQTLFSIPTTKLKKPTTLCYSFCIIFHLVCKFEYMGYEVDMHIDIADSIFRLIYIFRIF